MNKGSFLLGIILIIAGIIFGLQTTNLLPGSSFLFILGAAFLAGYVVSGRKLGLLIPGCIITAIAAFSTLAEIFPNFPGAYMLVFLGLAFISIYLIHTLRMSGKSFASSVWPLYPGSILLSIGFIILLLEDNILGLNARTIGLIFPILLILCGGVIILRNLLHTKKDKKNISDI